MESGKEILREHFKHKRAHGEMDDDASDDLFAKKTKYDLTDEEKSRQLERRKRNKEAAEKSRKKKKDEFEKIQIENDQLNQDKCEMAAMIEKLKTDNSNLTLQLEVLKRWIAKHSKELGIDKHIEQQKKQQETVTVKEEASSAQSPPPPSPALLSSPDSVLHGDPFLHSVKSEPRAAPEEQNGMTVSSSASSAPKSDKVRSVRRYFPWLIDQPSDTKPERSKSAATVEPGKKASQESSKESSEEAASEAKVVKLEADSPGKEHVVSSTANSQVRENIVSLDASSHSQVQEKVVYLEGSSQGKESVVYVDVSSSSKKTLTFVDANHPVKENVVYLDTKPAPSNENVVCLDTVSLQKLMGLCGITSVQMVPEEAQVVSTTDSTVLLPPKAHGEAMVTSEAGLRQVFLSPAPPIRLDVQGAGQRPVSSSSSSSINNNITFVHADPASTATSVGQNALIATLSKYFRFCPM